ncbi:MAG: SpvB/TcaC N-terminal domain-containing protein, partial [Spirochaetes bacterium]|nr:SpvB/TcaC N-terminal domain-containing protein [Spirochaetota bacterium]
MFYRITASLILASMLITSCTSGSGGSSSKAAAEGSYPSPGTSGDTVGAPSGTDAFSASTNRSSKDDETSAKPDPFAGAAFVRPPDINNYGAVSLAYAIETIPGRAGMQPSVGLSYSSSGGDGLCGIGWNLSTGFGVISRTTRVGQLYYDYRDEFTYNGSRLVKVSGPATSEEGTYRLEIESAFTRFELTDTATGGVWRVTDSSGTVTFYGQTVNERIYHPADNSKTYIWNFSRSEDLRGNYMAAEYDRSSYGEDNISYLETIHYTGNSHESHAPERFVKFEYGERPSGESYTTTAAGFPMSINRILEKISTGAGSETLWYYEPVYTISADSSRPVMQTVKSSRTVTEPEFIYQPASHTLAWQKIPNPYYSDFESSPADTKFFEGDFNGDGQSDMLVYNPANGSFKAAEANRNGSYDFKTYASDVRFAGLKGQRVKWLMGSGVGDYTGNGKSDIAFYVTQTKTFWVATFKDGAFNFVNYGTLPHEIDPFSMESFPGDYDGNGLSDIMLFDEQSGNWIVMYNRGDRFDFIKVAENLKNLFRFDYTPDASLNSQSTHDTLPEGSHRGMVRFFVGDYSANGRSDIAFYDERSKSFFVADVSRDEQERIRMSWRLLKRFTVPESAIFSNENFSGDFNGDGYSDFIFFDRDAGEWIAGFTDANTINFKKYGTTPAFKNITRFLQGDFNGDGRTDIGFYCHDDGNFWIGEGAPEGFRFRIYNNITYGGPDRARVMATPHPKEGVREGAYSGFDGHNNRVVRTTLNTNERSGLETLFTIASETSSAVIIYDSKTNTFSYKKENRNTAVSVIKPESDVVFPYNHAVRMDGDKTGLIYYTVSSSVNADKIYNYHILHDASGNLTSSPIASFDQSEIGFDPQSSLVNWGKFGGEYALAFLNDRVDEYEDVTIRLYKLDVDSFDEFTVSGNSAAGELVKEDLVNISQNPSVALFASGGLTSDDALVISGINNRIYAVAGFNTGDAVFAPVSEEDFTVNSTGLVSSRSTTNGLAVVTQNESMYSVTRYIVNGTTKTFESKEVIDKPVTDNFFAGFTSDGLAVFQSGDIFVISAVSADTPIDETQANNLRVLERDDFITRAYPFAWKQGDYNGDGKTDIGIFDLKETHFYFARTTGTVPDLLSQVKNGIGGSYYMEYANSTSFDNTGDDDVPDLGVNYKVCTSLRVEDGEGHSVKTRYEYAGGFAFSEFINGRKEVDYFGFSDFKKISAYGAVEHTEYHTTPYDDFRKNRALAGAVKRSSFKGSDGVLYKETEHEYRLHTITPSGFIEPASYIVVPSAVKTWSEGVHVLTDEVELELGEEYSLKRRVSRSTDHYSDDLRSPVTTENITEYEYIESTNENREIKTISMPGTDFETVTSVVYNYEGLPELNQVSYTGGTLDKPSDQVVYYEYDSYGNMIREENRSDSPYRVSEITYDSRFKTFPEQSRVLADGSKWLTENSEYNYDFAFGQMKQKTDANGNRTRFEYDQQGRLSRQYADTDDGEKLFNEYNYSDGTYPMWVKTVQHSGTDDPARISTVYADGTGRVIHSVRSASDGAAVRSGRISYDAEGRVTRKGQSYWTDRGELDRFSRPSDEINPTLYSYDGAGRVKRVTLPQSEDESEPYYTETEYNGPYETVQKNSRGYSKTTRTNGLGLVLSVIESGTGDDGVARNASIGFAYDAAGRRIKKMDTNGRAMNVQVDNSLFAQGKKDQSGANICQWKYDGFGRVIESSDADLGYSSTVYNAFGDTRSVTTARGLTTSYQYDRLGRVTKEILSGDEGEVEYVYDEAVNGKGKLSQVTSPAMTKLFAYDKLGRVKTETRTISNNGGTYTNDYAYDLFNRH